MCDHFAFWKVVKDHIRCERCDKRIFNTEYGYTEALALLTQLEVEISTRASISRTR